MKFKVPQVFTTWTTLKIAQNCIHIEKWLEFRTVIYVWSADRERGVMFSVYFMWKVSTSPITYSSDFVFISCSDIYTTQLELLSAWTWTTDAITSIDQQLSSCQDLLEDHSTTRQHEFQDTFEQEKRRFGEDVVSLLLRLHTLLFLYKKVIYKKVSLNLAR